MWMKKRYILKLADDQVTAEVARREAETQVRLGDAEPLGIDAVPVMGGRALSVRLGNRQHLVHLTGMDRKGTVAATLDGRPFRLTVMDELKAQALESLGDAGGSGTILADIPGLVIEIRVRPGQQVHQGEPVIVVEAMKMQNELGARVSGVVREIPVKVGQSVNPGDPLVVIEPDPGG